MEEEVEKGEENRSNETYTHLIEAIWTQFTFLGK